MALGLQRRSLLCHTHHRLAESDHTGGHRMTEHIEQAHWGVFFNDFAKKHHGFEARLELISRAFGDQEVAAWLPFTGIRIKLSIDSLRKHDGFVVLTYTLLQHLRGGPSFSRGLGRQTFGGGTDVCEKAA